MSRNTSWGQASRPWRSRRLLSEGQHKVTRCAVRHPRKQRAWCGRVLQPADCSMCLTEHLFLSLTDQRIAPVGFAMSGEDMGMVGEAI
jgi:hypothetical protein